MSLLSYASDQRENLSFHQRAFQFCFSYSLTIYFARDLIILLKRSQKICFVRGGGSVHVNFERMIIFWSWRCPFHWFECESWLALCVKHVRGALNKMKILLGAQLRNVWIRHWRKTLRSTAVFYCPRSLCFSLAVRFCNEKMLKNGSGVLKFLCKLI